MAALNEFNEAGQNLNAFSEDTFPTFAHNLDAGDPDPSLVANYYYEAGGVVKIKNKRGELVPFGITNPDGTGTSSDQSASVTFLAIPVAVNRVQEANSPTAISVILAEPKAAAKNGNIDTTKGYYFFVIDVSVIDGIAGYDGATGTLTSDAKFGWWTGAAAGGHVVAITMRINIYSQNGQMADYLEGNSTAAPAFMIQSDGKGNLQVDQETLKDPNRMIHLSRFDRVTATHT